MNTTQDWVQHSYVGDNFDEIRLGLFTDADFAGDKSDSESTSGVFIAAIGPHTYAAIVSISKKQGCVSTSTCESEVVAMNLGLKEAIWILGRPWNTFRGVLRWRCCCRRGRVRRSKKSRLVCREGSRPEKGTVDTQNAPSTTFGIRR